MRYQIYQIKDIGATAYSFREWDFAKGHEFNINDYEVVYSKSLHAKTIDLDHLFVKFNMDRPEDFKGHSLSVSDIVKLTDGNNVNRYYYCDPFGWEEITDQIESVA